MAAFVAGRLLQVIPVVILVTIAATLMVELVPGDPARIDLGFTATPQQIAERQEELGLNESLPAQYWEFVSGAVTFDFGNSFDTEENVGDVVARRAPPSLLLIGYSLLVSVLLALPAAIAAAVWRGRWIDHAIRFVSTVAFAMPVFWLALLLVMVVSIQWGLLPTSGYGDTFPDHIRSLTLPALTMGLVFAPVLMRLLRSAIIETRQSEFVEAARARGLSEARVMVKHVLRNSVMSTVTFVGILIGVLLSATVVVEQIFSIPGLGSLLVAAVDARDYPMVQALVLLFGVAVPLVSLLTDVAYAWLDPRVRL